MSKPIPASRTRRLRKKLHVGEFQQLGFNVDFTLDRNLPPNRNQRFWDSFIADPIEVNHLSFGGGESGFVVPEGRDSATDAHRQAVRSWLQARPEVISVAIGPLVDAWHADRS
ncbi:MAG: YggL family protein [Pseudomonadota bacterium]